jgi:hypothetical protein
MKTECLSKKCACLEAELSDQMERHDVLLKSKSTSNNAESSKNVAANDQQQCRRCLMVKDLERELAVTLLFMAVSMMIVD